MVQASLNLNHPARVKKLVLLQLHQLIKHVEGLYFWRGKVGFLNQNKNKKKATPHPPNSQLAKTISGFSVYEHYSFLTSISTFDLLAWENKGRPTEITGFGKLPSLSKVVPT